MSRVNESDGLRSVRHGTCHRCGWEGQVGHLVRRDRKYLPEARKYRRLCSDCASALRCEARPASAAPAGLPHRKTTQSQRKIA